MLVPSPSIKAHHSGIFFSVYSVVKNNIHDIMHMEFMDLTFVAYLNCSRDWSTWIDAHSDPRVRGFPDVVHRVPAYTRAEIYEVGFLYFVHRKNFYPV